MCEIMERLNKEAINERNKAIAIEMLEDGKLSYEEIAKYSHLSLEEVRALAEGKPA